MTRSYTCNSCGRKFKSVAALGGHRGYCVGGNSYKDCHPSEVANRYRSSTEVAATSPATSPATSLPAVIGEVATIAKKAWQAPMIGEPLPSLDTYQPPVTLPAPLYSPQLKRYAMLGGAVLGVILLLRWAMQQKQPVASSGVKVPGMGGLAEFLPPSVLSIMALLWVSKMARGEMSGWIKNFDKWGKS